MTTIRRALFCLPLILAASISSAQEKSICELVVPATLSVNAELASQASCPCRITAFKATVMNRWGMELWTTDTLEGFPRAVMQVEDVPDGTYPWMATYTAIMNDEPVELKRMGYFTVLR